MYKSASVTLPSNRRPTFGRPELWMGWAVIMGLCGCGSDRNASDGRDFSGIRAAERVLESSPASSGDRQPAAVVGDQSVSWDDLRPRLAEASGGVVIEEIVLDRLVQQELKDRGWSVVPAEVAREKELFVDQLRRSANVGEDASAKLLSRLRYTRGLGPVRFKALLERNATLRRLVRDGIEIDESALAQELEVRYGPRTTCRIIVVGTESEAGRARARLLDAGPDLVPRFAAQAQALSLDPSASRGGLLGPMSAADPSYAVAVRSTLGTLKPGQLSGIIALENGYALLLVEGQVPAEAPPVSARAEVETALRLRLERVAMDRLAQRLLNNAPVTVFDQALGWSWQARLAPTDGK